MEKKELPEEIQIKKFKKRIQRLNIYRSVHTIFNPPRHFRCKKEIVTNP